MFLKHLALAALAALANLRNFNFVLMQSLTWSIFCRVIDNYGDAGVCIRLAKDLASKNQRIRLWIDEPKILNWMAPDLDSNISVHPWPDLPTKEACLVDVILEAFGCEIPQFIQEEISNSIFTDQKSKNRYQRIQWINLEYLSGEAYAKKNHGLMSPVLSGIGCGATKWFFYPGFEEGTGGLLLEDMTRRKILASENTVQKSVNTLNIGIFCYHDAPLHCLIRELIQQFNNQESTKCTKFRVNVAAGQAQLKLKNEIAPLHVDSLMKDKKAGFSFNYLRYMTQEDFDDYLWANDINFIRGEDSLIRAIWTGKPWVWQIYPQENHLHLKKLNALLELLVAPAFVKKIHKDWNTTADEAVNIENFEFKLPDVSDTEIWSNWHNWCRTIRIKLLQQRDLSTQLVSFVYDKRQKTVEY